VEVRGFREEHGGVFAKWINDNASEEDVKRLNELIAQRAAQGWEYVNHTYSQSIFNWKQSFHYSILKS